MNHRAKFDAASFILAGEIRNRTNTQNYKQTVNDISALCLSACVDNNETVFDNSKKMNCLPNRRSSYRNINTQNL